MAEDGVDDDIHVEWTDFLLQFHDNHQDAQQRIRKVKSSVCVTRFL